MNTRHFILAALGATALLVGGIAHAQGYPDRPIKLLVPWPAGGASDIIARTVALKMADLLGQPFVVENKPGANGQIGMLAVARAAPDGYTLVLATATTHAIGPAGSHKLPYDTATDFVHVGSISVAPTLLIVPSSSLLGSVKDVIAQSKAEPGKLSYASYGIGSAPHLAAEMFSQATGIKMLHIPYQGTAPASQALLGGQVSLYFDSVPSGFPLAKANRVKALAFTGLKRNAVLPDVPTVSEFVPGFELTVWWGLSAPKGVEPAIIQKLSGALQAVMVDPAVKARMADFGAEPRVSNSDEFTAFVAKDRARWAEVLRKGNIALD